VPPRRLLPCAGTGPPARPGAKGARIAFLGIDIGGTKTVLALGDGAGAVQRRRRIPTRPSGDAEADLLRLAEQARGLTAEAGVSLDEVRAIGVSVPGPLDPEQGVVLHPPNLAGWGRVPVRTVLERELGRPVRLENDANAGALAEWRFGAGRGTRHMVYLTMSTGVGGGLVLGGRVHRGLACSAGEVGHMPVVWNGEPCACGQRGCLEAYIGGAAWSRRLARETPRSSAVARLAGSPEAARPEHVVTAARQGDAFAQEEMSRYNDYLCRALVTLSFVLAPQLFVLGTIARAAGEDLCIGPVRKAVASRLWPELREGVRIEAGQLGEQLPERAGLAVAMGDSAGPA